MKLYFACISIFCDKNGLFSLIFSTKKSIKSLCSLDPRSSLPSDHIILGSFKKFSTLNISDRAW